MSSAPRSDATHPCPPLAGTPRSTTEDETIQVDRPDHPRSGTHFGEDPDAGEPVANGTVVLQRYVILELIGSGSVGRVYCAYDPELDRKVALKFLRPNIGQSTSPSIALQREAQAIARVTDPNVISVFDVGVETSTSAPICVGTVYLVMEFVEGQELKTWLGPPGSRSWREIVGAFIQAAKGLAAAHAAGVIHRDFKPSNALVGHDGRVCVIDFGLARLPSRAASGETQASGASFVPVDASQTATGTVMGTPRYMAPEQHRGDVCDEHTDQYAFCVALYEALFGAAPFSGDTFTEMAAAKQRGSVAMPRRAGVPRWLARTIARGLSVEPSRRWPSMAALVAELSQVRVKKHRRWFAAGAAGLLVAGTVGGVYGQRRNAIATCRADAMELIRSWNSRRDAIQLAVLATQLPDAHDTWDRWIPWVDRYADDWRSTSTDVCLAGNVDESWPRTSYETAQACLSDRRDAFLAHLEVMEQADAKSLRKAVYAAATLPSLQSCVDSNVLARPADLLPPQSQRTAVASINKTLARAQAMERSGRNDDGLAAAQKALSDAETLGWPPLVAKAQFHLGKAFSSVGDFPRSEQYFERAFFGAGEVNADDIAIDAALALMNSVGFQQARYVEGERWAEHAQMLLRRAGLDSGLRRAELLRERGELDYARGQDERAATFLLAALDTTESVLGPNHPTVANVANSLGMVRNRQNLDDQAEVLLRRALEIWEETAGPTSKSVASALDNLALVLRHQNRYEEALQVQQRALTIQEALFGARHPEFANTSTNLGLLFEDMGRYDEAYECYERALAIFTERLGPNHPNVAYVELGLAFVELKREHPAAALTHARRGLEIRQSVEQAANLQAEAEKLVAQAMWAVGEQRSESLVFARRALQRYEGLGDAFASHQKYLRDWIAARKDER